MHVESGLRRLGGSPDAARESYAREIGGFVSIPEIVLLLVVALLVFGPKRLPEIGQQLGKGLREFKRSVTDGDEDSRPNEELPTSRD